ncbi:DEKNAAC103039 [Brettanomyces naardenensis]|uniref:DEKNAAC103039 n=1 Tax=Brettanomyces naardenensis TaxID=13370 RepID=A0A448YM90_BRENA|nr:DEKNAAC103039 [Brettanomyces naardenensis]
MDPNSGQKIIVNTVVNANNAFISSLDHLPCDLVRSLWLIQSLNLKNEKLRQRLDQLTKKKDKRDETLDEVRHLITYLTRNSRECVRESIRIKGYLKNHLKFIDNDLKILERLCQFKETNKDSNLRWQEFDSFKRNFIREHADEVKSAGEYGNSILIKGRKHSIKIKINLKGLKRREHLEGEQLIKRPRGRPRKVIVKDVAEKQVADQASSMEYASSVEHASSVENAPSVEQVPAVDKNIYCFCRLPSFGRMICCDNASCEYQWFHYKCVGLFTDPDPKKKWFCSEKCHNEYWDSINKKKRRHRHSGKY